MSLVPFQQFALISQLCSNSQGSYFNDYCNWQRIQEFQQFAFESPVKGESILLHSICIEEKAVKNDHKILLDETGGDLVIKHRQQR